MRDLLEKALNKGLTVSFTSENGFDVIRISSGNDVVASCSLGTTSFRASVEESLQALLLDLERKGFQRLRRSCQSAADSRVKLQKKSCEDIAGFLL